MKQDSNWSYKDFNLAAYNNETKALQATLSPTDPDLSAFRSKGGKLLMYHGWSDSALSPCADFCCCCPSTFSPLPTSRSMAVSWPSPSAFRS